MTTANNNDDKKKTTRVARMTIRYSQNYIEKNKTFFILKIPSLYENDHFSTIEKP